MSKEVNLNRSDIDLLFDALSAWEKAEGSSKFFGAMMETIFLKDADESKHRADRVADEIRHSERKRMEASIMVKAKLLQIRNWLDEHETETTQH